MFAIILILIFTRPFISSLAFPYLNLAHSSLLILSLIAWFLIKGTPFQKIKSLKYPLILFCLALLISLFFSQNRQNSLAELYKYIMALLIFLFAASLQQDDKITLLRIIILSGLAISLLAAYQYFFGFQHILNYLAKKGPAEPFVMDYIERKRAFFPFATPNLSAGYLIMVIPLALISKNRIWLVLPLTLALLLTKSLGALFSLFLAMLLYIYLKSGFRGKKLVFAGGLLGILMAVFVFRQAAAKEYFLPSFSLARRLVYWQDALIIIKTFFLTGVGPGNFNTPFSRYAHNSYLQIWAEMGIIGIISFIWLTGAILKLGLAKIENSLDKTCTVALIIASIIFLIHNFFDFTFFLPEINLLWWIIVGLLTSIDTTACKGGGIYLLRFKI